jgi:hypothetical protein
MKTREIKVQEQWTKLKGKNRMSVKPRIILCGKWLEQAGIYSGDAVSVVVVEDQIIISAQ